MVFALKISQFEKDIFDPLSSRSKSDDDLHNLSFPGDTPLPPIPTPTNIPSQDHHFAKPKLPGEWIEYSNVLIRPLGVTR